MKKSDIIIVKLIEENTFRFNSRLYNSFKIIQAGMTVEEYLKNNGHPRDLRDFIKKSFVKLVDRNGKHFKKAPIKTASNRSI